MARLFVRASGTVDSFDESSGLGVIRSDDGELTDFHCVSIADGTRRIGVGEPVEFIPVLVLGRVEASAITPLL